MIIKRGSLTFYVKNQSVIVGIGSIQYSAYTVYPLQNRKPFYDFRKTIVNSKDTELTSPVELITLAKRYNLRGVASHRPTQKEMDENGYKETKV
jgi:hypothetical protein